MMKLRSNVGVLLLYLLAAVLVVYSLSLVFLSNFNMGNLMVWLLTGCVTGYAVFRRPVNAWFSAGIGRVVFGVLAVLVCFSLAYRERAGRDRAGRRPAQGQAQQAAAIPP